MWFLAYMVYFHPIILTISRNVSEITLRTTDAFMRQSVSISSDLCHIYTLLTSPAHEIMVLMTPHCITSFSPGRCGSDFNNGIFKLSIRNCTLCTRWKIAFRWMPQNLTDDKSILVRVMAWSHQATSHYLSQCWTRSTWTFWLVGPTH